MTDKTRAVSEKTGVRPMKRVARLRGSRSGGPNRDAKSQALEALSDKGEQLRRRILDATLACYVAYGWGGTNMSVIARQVGMTRGMIQYYFPTLDDVLRASVAHLNNEWRKKYFSYVEQENGAADRLEVGLGALWRLMQDPLHVAKQELMAAARSNAELRAVIQKEAGFDEATTLDMAKHAYPDLARQDETVFRHALDFTVIFLEGLSRHQFSNKVETRCKTMLGMLKNYLDAYWRSQGVDVSPRQLAVEPELPSPSPLDDRDRDRVLALLLKAASILSDRKDDSEIV